MGGEAKKKTFLEPNAFKRDPKTGEEEVDHANSEEFCLLEALGTPRVFYALTQNVYFKDAQCSKEFSDTEIHALGLPLPIEIETARRKLVKAANDTGTLVNMAEIRRATAPASLQSPPEIQSRIVTNDPVERTLNRINRTTLGR